MRRAAKRTYGEGSITKDGKRWRIRWRQGGGRRSSTHPTRELAQAALRIITGNLARGDAGLPVDPTTVPRLGALAAEWFAHRAGPHNRNNDDERRKWNNHLEPVFGRLRPDQVTAMLLGQFIRDKAGDKQAKSYTRQLLAILSSLFTHLVTTGRAQVNPVRLLPKDVRRRVTPDYDWQARPYLENKSDIRRVYRLLPEPFSVAFAIGVMRGLRPGEIRALAWSQVDLDARLIHVVRQVRHSRVGPPKGGKARTVTISDALYAALAPWRLRCGGKGLVIPPQREGRHIKWMAQTALGKELRAVLVTLKLPPLTFYEATKHTFASHWVRDGGSLETLRVILGHSSSDVTKRYAHLQPDRLRPEDTERAQVDLRPGAVVAFKR